MSLSTFFDYFTELLKIIVYTLCMLTFFMVQYKVLELSPLNPPRISWLSWWLSQLILSMIDMIKLIYLIYTANRLCILMISRVYRVVLVKQKSDFEFILIQLMTIISLKTIYNAFQSLKAN